MNFRKTLQESMNRHTVLFASTFLCFAAAIFCLWLAPSTEFDTPLATVVDEKLRAFRDRETPQLKIEWQPSTTTTESFDPALTLAQTHRYAHEEMRILLQPGCTSLALNSQPLSPNRHFAPDPRLRKAYVWKRFLCSETPAQLPTNFFQTPPLMHPSGKSFVALAIQSGQPAFQQTAWQLSVKEFAHISELESLGLAHTVAEHFFSSLAGDTLQKLLTSTQIFYDGTHVFMRVRDETKTTNRIEWLLVYALQDWQKFFSTQNLSAKPITDDGKNNFCTYRTDDMCWSWHGARGEFMRTAAVTLFALGSALLILNGAWLLAIQMKARRELQLQQEFLLQTLTHELRTPIASLQLIRESLRDEFDTLSERGQKNFLRLCDEVQRLNRLSDASVQYLNLHEKSGMALALVRVESINALVVSVSASFAEGLQVVPLVKDAAVVADAYWLGVCLRNLLDNAFRHGRAPVCVRVCRQDAMICLVVEDGGQLLSTDKETLGLNRLSERKGHQGLGIGLTLVSRILEKMNGALRIEKSPTQFILILKEVTTDANPNSVG